MAGQDRRGFLSRLARDATRAAYELDSALRLRQEPGEDDDEARPPELVDADPGRSPVEPAAVTATVEDLRRLCRELGLEAFADAAAAAARTSIRLTRTADGRRTGLGGMPALPPGFEPPSWQDEPLELLLRVDLAELPPSPLPPAGTLLLFFALAAAPDGTRPEHEGACRVVVTPTPGAGERDEVPPEVALAPSAELTLPVEPPGSPDEACDYESWLKLRMRLAAFQGVELEDELPEHRAMHRLLGHPDSLAAPIAPEAEHLDGAASVAEPAGADGDPATDWRLLVQLSAEPSTRLVLPAEERLFVWIADDDLRARRFDRTRAFVR